MPTPLAHDQHCPYIQIQMVYGELAYLVPAAWGVQEQTQGGTVADGAELFPRSRRALGVGDRKQAENLFLGQGRYNPLFYFGMRDQSQEVRLDVPPFQEPVEEPLDAAVLGLNVGAGRKRQILVPLSKPARTVLEIGEVGFYVTRCDFAYSWPILALGIVDFLVKSHGRGYWK